MAEMVRYNDYYVDMAYVLVKQKSNDGRPMNRIITDNEKIMNSLKLDKMGIVADVLIKHNIIKYVDTLYVKFKGNTTF